MSTCYANPNPVFQPAMRIISAITNANPAVVTTTFAHQYVSGTIVRLDIPPADGMQQITGQTFPILVTGSTTFTVPIDTTLFDAFSIPVSPIPPYANICAMAVPVGEVSATLKAATINVLNPQQVMGG
jgi:hypothetical protein